MTKACVCYSETEGGAHENPVASASFIQSDDKVPVLDFLNQEPFEEEVFKGFSNEYGEILYYAYLLFLYVYVYVSQIAMHFASD